MLLVRLEEQGLVTGVAAGPSRLYQLNREHVAGEVAVALAGLRTRFFARVRDDFAAWPVAPVSAALFGSVARGEADTASDIDLLLVRPNDVADDSEPWGTSVFALAEKVLRWTGNDASMLQVTVAELGDMLAKRAPVIDSLTLDAIDLAGAPIRELLASRAAA